ncbi:MAG: radical SAM protein [Deltaproteobacteria bacterium]|nr:radical SAM protein [Deltaproteobacteria bacterium]
MDFPEQHPCFSQKCPTSYGRIHLPVAPNCNIFCRFCCRGVTESDQQPGQTARLLKPQEALDVMDLALILCPDIKVAGVAGPGDPLASPEALDTLLLIKEKYPWIMACLSTNGLALAASMEKLLIAGVETLTVTVNAVNPAVLENINRGVLIDGQFAGRRYGAEMLIAAQEEGIRLACQNHLIVKINTVLVPGVNDGHVAQIAETTKKWGAELINIIPLIPSGELINCQAPSQEEQAAAILAAEKHLTVKRNCRRCRADACGIPGGPDYAKTIYGNLNFAETFSHG